MIDNDWFFEAFHDDADNSLGLTRGPEIAFLVMLVLGGIAMGFAILYSMVA